MALAAFWLGDWLGRRAEVGRVGLVLIGTLVFWVLMTQ